MRWIGVPATRTVSEFNVWGWGVASKVSSKCCSARVSSSDVSNTSCSDWSSVTASDADAEEEEEEEDRENGTCHPKDERCVVWCGVVWCGVLWLCVVCVCVCVSISQPICNELNPYTTATRMLRTEDLSPSGNWGPYTGILSSW